MNRDDLELYVMGLYDGDLAALERELADDPAARAALCASFQEGDGIHARYYLAQELIAGEALDDRLESHWFTEAEILAIARQVLDVLVYLQGLSPMVIHRDIKPANLLVRPDGAIAVVDFGAAHVHGATAASTAIGTFGYMPIEQLAGEVDATTDLIAEDGARASRVRHGIVEDPLPPGVT
ncbi:MAG TPA: phosphotransferase [Kofleriaceae bacterium]